MAETTIAGLARKGGVGVETVRYYQRRGLLDTPERTGGTGLGGGIRRYGEEDDSPLAIHPFRPGGRIHARTDPRADRTGCGRRPRERARALANERLTKLDAKIAELEAARKSLRRLARDCAATSGGPCPIISSFSA